LIQFNNNFIDAKTKSKSKTKSKFNKKYNKNESKYGEYHEKRQV